ncbi:hypothetical protein Tco_0581068 [Tanacetum coccineum]
MMLLEIQWEDSCSTQVHSEGHNPQNGIAGYVSKSIQIWDLDITSMVTDSSPLIRLIPASAHQLKSLLISLEHGLSSTLPPYVQMSILYLQAYERHAIKESQKLGAKSASIVDPWPVYADANLLCGLPKGSFIPPYYLAPDFLPTANITATSAMSGLISYLNDSEDMAQASECVKKTPWESMGPLSTSRIESLTDGAKEKGDVPSGMITVSNYVFVIANIGGLLMDSDSGCRPNAAVAFSWSTCHITCVRLPTIPVIDGVVSNCSIGIGILGCS